MSYLIKNGQLLAKTVEELKSGEEVRFSNTKSKDRVNTDRNEYLVNAEYAQVSNAKKWDRIYTESNLSIADILNDNGLYKEYLVS